MPDTFSPAKRSAIMRAVRSKDTAPELVVRRLIHSLGYRYRLHVRSLPGCPDVVLPWRKKVLFVHGCFWHQHSCSRGNRIPASNRRYWLEKLRGNKHRDAGHRRALRRRGWRVLTVWECQTTYGKLDTLAARICNFLES